MNITVIIPIYNAGKFLPSLFHALDKNHFNERDEVLLVDNGSTDDSISLCEEQVKQKPELYRLLLFHEKAGSYAARNYAVKQAKGDAFVFTDGDTKPIPTWLDSIRNTLKPGIVVAGKIELEIINNGLWELFDNLAHLNSEKNALCNQVATANMAVMRTDFFSVGLFEERFSGGDYDWSTRAKASGLSIVFDKDAMVYHPTRKTFEQIIKKEQRIAYGAGNHYKLKKKPLLLLIARYVAKIFKIDTNIRHHNALKKLGVSKEELHEFDRKFWKIRTEQLKYAVRGYRMIDARKLDVK